MVTSRRKRHAHAPEAGTGIMPEVSSLPGSQSDVSPTVLLYLVYWLLKCDLVSRTACVYSHAGANSGPALCFEAGSRGKMLDFFTIFSKGGIVLWCFQGAGVSQPFSGAVNTLIRSVILQVGLGGGLWSSMWVCVRLWSSMWVCVLDCDPPGGSVCWTVILHVGLIGTQRCLSFRDTCAVCCHINLVYNIFFFLQERSGNNSFTHEALTLKYKLDNEFELLFVVSSFIYSTGLNQNVQETFTLHVVAHCITLHLHLPINGATYKLY